MTVEQDAGQQAPQAIVLEMLGRAAPAASWCLDLEGDQFAVVVKPSRPIMGEGVGLERMVRRPYEVLEAGSAALWSSALDRARTAGMGWDLVLEFHSPSGSHGWVRTLGRAELRENRVVRLYGVAQDITVLVALERGLHNLQLMADVAPGLAELSQLLAAIEQCEEAAAEALPEWHPVHSDLAALAVALGKGREIMGEILSLAAHASACPVPLDLAGLIADMYPALRRAMGPRIHIDMIRSTRLSPVLADRRNLELALLALALSSRDRMPRGGALTLMTREVVSAAPQPTLTGVRPAGTFVELAVSDSGPAIDEPTRARLFRPCLDGTGGIGLLKCLRIVRRFDGIMDLASSPIAGTTVLLWLPVAPAAPDATLTDSTGKQPA